jgi:hypothetical protein
LGQHHEAGQFWLARAFELLEVVFDEHAGQLAGAVGAEVHEDHGVAVFDLHRFADGGGLDELVALATGVGRFRPSWAVAALNSAWPSTIRL